MRPKPAILFDVDGTLIDTVDFHAEAWQKALAHFGVHVRYQDVRAQIGKGGDQLLPVFLTKAQIAELGEKLEEWRTALYKREYMPRAQPFPKVRELVEELRRRGIRVALASSAKSDELKFYESLLGIPDLIDAETSKDDAARSKPHPDIFAAALAKAGGDKKHTVVVGDTPWDAIAARRLGVGAVGVLCGGFSEADLRESGCERIYRDPAHLLERLEEWAPIQR